MGISAVGGARVNKTYNFNTIIQF